MTAAVSKTSEESRARAFLANDLRMFIGGKWENAADGSTSDVFDPALGEVICKVPRAKAADVERAVAAARTAFTDGAWRRTTPSHRQLLLLRLADRLEAHADTLAELESIDSGKLIAMARRVDVQGAVDFLRYMAGWATKIEGRTIDVSFPKPRQGDYFAYTRKEPVGVVGAIIPWNFPLTMAVWKVAPALAAGCTVVLKPAEETPLTAVYLGRLLEEVGCPPGVVNIVTGGREAGAALASHPGIDKIAFTGSTEVGKMIGKAAMDNMTRLSLELGGKSPVIVLPDADEKMVIRGAANAIYFNHGQVCCAGSRLFVHRALFDRVVEGIGAHARSIKLGNGRDAASQMGPLISARQRERVQGYVRHGLSDGAKLIVGGDSPADLPGYFFSPTLLTDVRPDMRVVREEIFGPVLVAMPFDDVDSVVEQANDGPYGLAASIWSNDLTAVNRLVPRLKAGTIWINCHNLIDPALPFGGMKQSGLGREMGSDVIEMYTETKSVCMSV